LSTVGAANNKAYNRFAHHLHFQQYDLNKDQVVLRTKQRWICLKSYLLSIKTLVNRRSRHVCRWRSFTRKICHHCVLNLQSLQTWKNILKDFSVDKGLFSTQQAT